jgi:hypothetical protein
MSTAVPPADAAGPPVQHGVSAKKRAGWLAKRGTLWILALLLLVIALLVASFTFGLFTSSSANVGNTVATGAMSLDNDKEGAAIFNATMVPGDVETGTVTLSNEGDVNGAVVLSDSALADAPGPNGGDLSDVLQLRIVEDSGGAGAREWYNGLLSSMPDIPLGTWGPGVDHTFDFIVTLPASAGNAYQGSGLEVTYDWNATQAP